MLEKDTKHLPVPMSYAINDKVIQFTIPKGPSKEFGDPRSNIDQPSVSEKLSRLKRYHKESLESLQKKDVESRVNNVIQTAIYSRPIQCHFIDNIMAVITPHSIQFFQVHGKPNNESPPSLKLLGLSVKSEDIIILWDFEKREGEGLDVVYVTKNPSGIYSMHLNDIARKIGFNEKIYGINFLPSRQEEGQHRNAKYAQSNILIRFDKEILIYSKKMEPIKLVEITFPALEKPDTLPFASLPTITKIHNNKIFFTYTAMVESPDIFSKTRYMVVLEEFLIHKEDPFMISGKQRVIVKYSKDTIQVRDMVIIENSFSILNEQPLNIYLLLKDEVVFIEQKPDNFSGMGMGLDIFEVPSFLAVECFIKPKNESFTPPSSEVQILPSFLSVRMKEDEGKAKREEIGKDFLRDYQKDHRSDSMRESPQECPDQNAMNVFLIQMDSRLVMLKCNYNTSTPNEPSTIYFYEIGSKEISGGNSICRLECKLTDIIIILDKFHPKKKITYSFYFNGMIIFILYDPLNPEMASVVYANSINFKDKLQKLLPNILPDNHKNDIVNDKKMRLLLQFNRIFSTKDNPDTDFYEQLWRKIKEIAFKKHSDSSNGIDQNNSSQPNLIPTFEGIIGKKNMLYLFRTEKLQYISKEMKDLIEQSGKISLDLLKTYYLNAKSIAARQIRDAGRDMDSMPLTEYLKSTFFLKKIEDFANQTEMNVAEYKRWKKKSVTEYFYQNWEDAKPTKINNFLSRYYSFFINSYREILKEIIQNHTIQGSQKQKSIWESQFSNVLKLLPKYPEERKLAEYYEKERNTNRENNNKGLKSIDEYIDFENIEARHEQTTFESITAEFPTLQKQEIQKNESLRNNYMRNNDFLFMSAKDLEEKKRNLTINKAAVYIYLELIREKFKVIWEEKRRREEMLELESVELTMEWVLERLRSHRNISMIEYFRLKIHINIYELVEQLGYHDLPSLSEYLQKSDMAKFDLLLFDKTRIPVGKTAEVFKEIKNIWSKVWEAIMQQGDRLFGRVLNRSEGETVSNNVDYFNNDEEIGSCIYECVLKKYFQQDDSCFEGSKMDRLVEVFQHIQKLPKDEKSDFRLLIDFLLESIFQTTPLKEQNESKLKEILRVISNFIQEQQKTKDNYFTPYNDLIANDSFETIEDKERILNYVCSNFHFFKEFELELTVNDLKMNFGGDNQPSDKFINQIEKIQTSLMTSDKINRVTFTPPSSIDICSLEDIFEVEKAFVQFFIYEDDDNDKCETILFKHFFEVALNTVYQKIPIRFPIEDLVKMQKKRMVQSIQSDRHIELLGATLLEDVINDFIIKAKEKTNEDAFIEMCLRMLESLHKQDRRDRASENRRPQEYINIENLLVKLRKKQFQPQEIEGIKIDYGRLIMPLPKDSDKKKELEETFIKEMSCYIDNKIKDTFEKGVPHFNDIKILLENFPRSYFHNESESNKAYDSNYLVVKLLIAILDDVTPLGPPSLHGKVCSDITSIMHRTYDGEQRDVEKELFGSDKKQAEEERMKMKDAKIKYIYKFVSDYFGTVDYNNMTQVLQDKWQSLTGRSPYPHSSKDRIISDKFSNVSSFSTIRTEWRNIEFSESDIRIYTYFPEYTKKIEYYMLGKMMDVQNKFGAAMTFLVRYWDEFKFDIDKVILLIKAFLSNPLRFQAPQEQPIYEVCLMLANLTKGNRYLTTKFAFDDLEQLLKVEKKALLDQKNLSGAKKNSNPSVVKRVNYLDQFVERLRNCRTQPKPLQNIREAVQQMTAETTSKPLKEHQLINNKEIRLTQSFISNNREDHGRSTEEKPQMRLEDAFTNLNTNDFISNVENTMDTVETSNNNFSLEKFRIFVRCVKFDKQLASLFKFKFFTARKQEVSPEIIFKEELEKSVEECINQNNYLRIGKALRYGFNNDMKMELNVTKLYLRKVMVDFQGKTRRDEIKDLEKTIKGVLDMIDYYTLEEGIANKVFDLFKNDSRHQKEGPDLYKMFQKILDNYMKTRNPAMKDSQKQ